MGRSPTSRRLGRVAEQRANVIDRRRKPARLIRIERGSRASYEVTFAPEAPEHHQRQRANRNRARPSPIAFAGAGLVRAPIARNRELLGGQHVVGFCDPGRISRKRHGPVPEPGIRRGNAELLGSQYIVRRVL